MRRSFPIAAALACSLVCGCSGGGGGGGGSPVTVTIGDRVWQDTNGNGLQEPGEPGLHGLTVTLEQGGAVVSTTVTDASGGYRFSGQPAGTYTLSVDPPGTLVPALASVGNDPTVDSDLSPATLSLAAGTTEMGTDFGFAGTGSVGDRIWIDGNCNGVQDPGERNLDGVRVILFDDLGFERDTYTVDGFYLFTNLSAGTYTVQVDDSTLGAVLVPTACNVGPDPELDSECSPATVVLPNDETRVSGIDFGYCQLGTGSIGDFVWHDVDLDGIQDAGEPGLPGVPVFLEDTSGMPIMQTTTDPSGWYLFDGLPPGSYVVDLAPPACFGATLCNVGPDDAVDSECAPVVVALAAGQAEATVDFGFVPAGTGEIGDFVWNDVDMDGLQDPGEMGIDQARVTLYDAAGNVLAVDWTGPNGHYLFQSLCQGTYVVVVDVTASGAGFVPSPCNVGNDDTIDNDCSPVWVVLPTDDTVDHTVDFGFHVPDPHEGCSHGYWKTHPGSWPPGYSAGMPFSAVFEDAFPGKTLLDVLWQGGGGLNALGRETVAAVLNAASAGVDYPRTEQEVIDRFNAVYPGSWHEYEQLKDEFESDNTLGCPLN